MLNSSSNSSDAPSKDDKDGSIRTPSPGKDYSSLLNDSSVEQFEEDPPPPTFNSETEYLRAQLEHLNSEKYLKIERHPDPPRSLESDKKELQQQLSSERLKYQQELEALTNELSQFKNSLNALKQKKNQEQELFNSKLKAQEDYFLKIIHEKDHAISLLELKVKEKKKAKTSRKIPEKTLSKPVFYQKQTYAGESKREQIQNISKMIVGLEKEQAELKQSLKDSQKLGAGERNSRKLIDLMTRNEGRLNEARSIQDDLIRSTLSAKHK